MRRPIEWNHFYLYGIFIVHNSKMYNMKLHSISFFDLFSLALYVFP